jgi:hypothetical protein
MDSQMREGAYFTNLLEGGSNMNNEFMLESPQDKVYTQQSPLDVQIVPISKKLNRVTNFTTEEDILLLSGWLNNSMDTIQENGQKHKYYWTRVWEYFHKENTFSSKRTANSLMNQWSTIQLGTNNFCGFLAQIERRNQSGVNEQDNFYLFIYLFK